MVYTLQWQKVVLFHLDMIIVLMEGEKRLLLVDTVLTVSRLQKQEPN